MSRHIYTIELHLTDGKVLHGRGRNVHSIVEGMINKAMPAWPRHHVTRLEHTDPNETGYPGTYQIYLGRGNSDGAPDGMIAIVAE